MLDERSGLWYTCSKSSCGAHLQRTCPVVSRRRVVTALLPWRFNGMLPLSLTFHVKDRGGRLLF